MWLPSMIVFLGGRSAKVGDHALVLTWLLSTSCCRLNVPTVVRLLGCSVPKLFRNPTYLEGKPVKRKIQTQGDFDGACFLYSLVNALQALTGKKVTQKMWFNFITSLPFKAENFLIGNIGTGLLSENTKNLEIIASNLVFQMKINASVFSVDGILTAKDMGCTINKNSVILVARDHGEHWVAVVDMSGENAFISCSARALEHDFNKPYQEGVSKNYGRVYNAISNFDEIKHWNGYALRVMLNE